MNREMFGTYLEKSVAVHGHLCPGQVLGVRMGLYGMGMVGILDPHGKDRKKLYLMVEIDRCATDALQSITGCSLGHRTMKFLDYGKMAATFVNLETDMAVRVLALEESKEKAKEYYPEITDKYRCQMEAYKIMRDDELFRHEYVRVRIPREDLPGKPLSRVRCELCGENVLDMREVLRNGKILCRACANGRYYSLLRNSRHHP